MTLPSVLLGQVRPMDQTISLYSLRLLTLPSSLTVCAHHQNFSSFILYAPTGLSTKTFHDCVSAVSWGFSITCPACVNTLSLLLYNHVPITRLASASLDAATNHVRFPSFSQYVLTCLWVISPSHGNFRHISRRWVIVTVTSLLSFHHRRYLPIKKIRGDGYSFSTDWPNIKRSAESISSVQYANPYSKLTLHMWFEFSYCFILKISIFEQQAGCQNTEKCSANNSDSIFRYDIMKLYLCSSLFQCLPFRVTCDSIQLEWVEIV